MPALKRRATSATPSYQTVSPVMYIGRVSRSLTVSTNPTTSPANGSIPAGPCRAGAAVTSTDLPFRACQRDGLPWRQPLGMSAKPLGARKRRENARGPAQEIATGPIEIVGMLVVTEQYGVDRSDVGRRTRRTRCFCQCRVRQPVFAGVIEGRIGQEAKPAEFDECRGTPNQGKTCCAHDHSSFQPRVKAGRVTR